MISIGLKDQLAEVPNLPTYAKSVVQHMAQQQDVSQETSSQSSDLHPR